MRYAFINGDEYAEFEPLVVVFDGSRFEIICQSHKRQKDYYDYIKRNNVKELDSFLRTFSYQTVETGQVTPEVESILNTLRAKFAVSQIADQEIEQQAQEAEGNTRQNNALLRISKRMRTGANER